MKLKGIQFLMLFVLALTPVCMWGQSGGVRTIKGVVQDAETNEPLTGVTVFALKSKAGATTDVNGEFVIKIQAADSLLSFSYVGYLPKRVNVTGKSNLTVSLGEMSKTVGEVVVVGYGTQKKKDLTGAISVVDMKEVNKLSASMLSQAL